MLVKKIVAEPVEAWELGVDTETYRQMVGEGKITSFGDGTYAIRSTEVTADKFGQLAANGDFFKIDGCGNPYPNTREWFLANHELREDGLYYQKAIVLEAWRYMGTGEFHEYINWLIETERLYINREDRDHYWYADMWGTTLSSPMDVYFVFREVKRTEDGAIVDIKFSFVDVTEFERTYRIVK